MLPQIRKGRQELALLPTQQSREDPGERNNLFADKNSYEALTAELTERIRGMLRGEEGHQWKWADIAAAAPSEDVLRVAAERAGFFETYTWATMKHWRLVGLAWPPDRREPDTSFTAHAELASVQPAGRRYRMMEPGLSKREARKRSGRKAMKDDADDGIDRMLDDQANEELILEKALEIEARRNVLVLGRQTAGEEPSAYLKATGYFTASLSALKKGLALAAELEGAERRLAFDRVQEIAAWASHAPAIGDVAPDALPTEFGVGRQEDVR